jgi:hypothetical protein
MTKPATPHPAPARFKVLRAIDPTVIGGAKVVEVSDESKHLKQVHYSNAKGGLRLVAGSEEVRGLAKTSALRLLQLAKS